MFKVNNCFLISSLPAAISGATDCKGIRNRLQNKNIEIKKSIRPD